MANPILGPDGQPLVDNFGQPLQAPMGPPTAPGFVQQDVSMSQGPVEAAKGLYNNASRGFGPMGLVSDDGSAAGVVGSVLGPVGGKQHTQDAGTLIKGDLKAQREATAASEVPEEPGYAGDRTANDDENARTLKELGLMSKLMGPVGGVAAPYFQAEGASMAGIGGPELYNEAFNNTTGAPGRRKAAMGELGELQQSKAAEMAGLYDRQAVQDQAAAEAMAVTRQQEQREIARQQEELVKATKYYSRDLRDQGKFWANPGNIVAAISYSLMPIFSNDPTVGVKLINQAVQQDLENRRNAADSELRGMRDNLDGYRKLAGDRQQGDLLARAEAHRMAAQEVARIGAKFSGPESAKAMKIAIADQETKAAAAEMEFYARYVHTAPKRTLPGETAALYKGPGGWAPLGQTAGAPSKAASPVNGEVAKGPSQAHTTGGFKSGVLPALARVGGVEAVDKVLSKPENAGKIGDQDVENVVVSLFRQQAALSHPGKPGAAIELYQEESKKLEPFVMKMAENAGRRRLVSQVRADMERIEQTERAGGRDPNEFISWARTAWPQKWVLEYEKFTASDPMLKKPGSAEQAAKFREEKAKELRAKLAGVLNQHNHELFGGAQSDGEMARAALEVGDKSSWFQTKKFMERQSQGLQAQVDEMKAGMTPMQRIMLRLRTDSQSSDSHLPIKSISAPGVK